MPDTSLSFTTNEPRVARILAAMHLTDKAISMGRYTGVDAVTETIVKEYGAIYKAIEDASRG